MLKAASPPPMLMTFNSLYIPEHLYFITATVCGWQHLFSLPGYADIVLNSLTWLRNEKRMSLYAFVLMPSHLHAIIKPLDRSIGDLLQNFASFTAHAILRQLREEKQDELLAFFHANKRDQRHNHCIWQDVQAKNIFTEKFLNQKMEYIHQNPVAKEWKLSNLRSEYRYSSACFYDQGRQPVIGIDDIKILF
jgi:putative transposase